MTISSGSKFEQYCDNNELWSDKDSGEIDAAKLDEYFNALKEQDENSYKNERDRFYRIFMMYLKLKDVAYSGEWGNPILADSLVIQKGSAETPAHCNGFLHMFEGSSAVKIDDTRFCYRDDNNGLYLFWKGDETAFTEAAKTASAFNAGYLALIGIGGLALGILGTTLVLLPKKKKNKNKAA